MILFHHGDSAASDSGNRQLPVFGQRPASEPSIIFMDRTSNRSRSRQSSRGTSKSATGPINPRTGQSWPEPLPMPKNEMPKQMPQEMPQTAERKTDDTTTQFHSRVQQFHTGHGSETSVKSSGSRKRAALKTQLAEKARKVAEAKLALASAEEQEAQMLVELDEASESGHHEQADREFNPAILAAQGPEQYQERDRQQHRGAVEHAVSYAPAYVPCSGTASRSQSFFINFASQQCSPRGPKEP